MIGQLSLFPPDKSASLKNRVELQICTTREARFTLETFHYLRRARVGRQINYMVLIDGMVDGVITYAYPMVSVPIAGVPSDEVIEFARLYLHKNLPHSASCAIGKSLRRVQSDWMRMFNDSKLPRLVVSWSDTEYHEGTVYKASNFQWLRRTKGSPPGNTATSKRGARAQHGDYVHDKDCWIYWLKQGRKP